MALHLLASMYPLVFSRSLRAMLVLVQSSAKSTNGMMLPLLEVTAIGEVLGQISSREAYPSSRLAWDEVSIGSGRLSCFCGRDMGANAVVGLLGDECWDPQLDASSNAQDSRLWTFAVRLPLDLGGDLGELVLRMKGMSLRGGIFWSSSSTRGEGMLISR